MPPVGARLRPPAAERVVPAWRVVGLSRAWPPQSGAATAVWHSRVPRGGGGRVHHGAYVARRAVVPPGTPVLVLGDGGGGGRAGEW